MPGTTPSEGRLVEREAESKYALRGPCGTEKNLGKQHGYSLDHLHDLGDTLTHRGLLRDAEKVLKQCLEGRTATLGEDHPLTMRTRQDLADVLRRQGLRNETKELLSTHRRASFFTRRHEPQSFTKDLLEHSNYNKRATLMRRRSTLCASGFSADLAQQLSQFTAAEECASLSSSQSEPLLARALGKSPVSSPLKTRVAPATFRELGSSLASTNQSRRAAEVQAAKGGTKSRPAWQGQLDSRGVFMSPDEVFRSSLKARRMLYGEEHSKTTASLEDLDRYLRKAGQRTATQTEEEDELRDLSPASSGLRSPMSRRRTAATLLDRVI